MRPSLVASVVLATAAVFGWKRYLGRRAAERSPFAHMTRQDVSAELAAGSAERGLHVSSVPEGRSRLVRWLRVGLRVAAVAVVVLLLLATCAVMILYSDYAARNGELQEMPLEGPADVIAGFEGSWYVGELMLKAKVEAGMSPSLTVRFGPDCKVRGARVEGDGLVFDYSCPEGSGATGLRFIEPGQLLWSKPGAPHSGCTTCTPTLTRASAWSRAKAWAAILGHVSSRLVEDGLDAVELWFVRHL